MRLNYDVDLFCLIFQIVMMERLMAQTGATPENVAKVSRTQSESKAGPECPVVSKGTFIILIVCLHFGQFHFQIYYTENESECATFSSCYRFGLREGRGTTQPFRHKKNLVPPDPVTC